MTLCLKAFLVINRPYQTRCITVDSLFISRKKTDGLTISRCRKRAVSETRCEVISVLPLMNVIQIFLLSLKNLFKIDNLIISPHFKGLWRTKKWCSWVLKFKSPFLLQNGFNPKKSRKCESQEREVRWSLLKLIA